SVRVWWRATYERCTLCLHDALPIYAVARFEAEFAEGRAKTAGATIEVPVTGANNGVVRLARHNFDAGKDFPGTLQDGRERQREIHHRAAHGTLPVGTSRAMLARIFGQGEEADGRRTGRRTSSQLDH